MAAKQKYGLGVVNLLFAVAVSLVINFSYFVYSIMWSQSMGEGRRMPPPSSHMMPDMQLYITLQILFFIVLVFILISVLTIRINEKNDSQHYVKRLVICFVVSVIFYLIAPSSNRNGDIIFMFNSHRIFNPMLMLKSSFALIVAALYGKIFELIYQQQHMVIENQMLKNENLQSRYNMLIGQINPHFFFNSLNSLSMLVRQEHKDKAIKYIDQLSDTFRYVLQNGHVTIATLDDELKFLDAYKYLLEIRYADKLFFDIDIPKQYGGYKLPTLSLQPLIENAVKHNMITSAKPFVVSLKIEDNFLVVSNPLIPKLEATTGTGIGLKNMSSRYMLLTGHNIIVEKTETHFTVKMPLIPVQI